MSPAMRIAVALMLATAMVEASQCSNGGECRSDDEPQNIVSLVQMNVLKGGGGGEVSSPVRSHPSGGNGDVPSSQRIAFLVRTHAPTAEATRRITQWVSSLQQSSDVDAFISIDQTDSSHSNDVSSLLNSLNSTGFNLSRIHWYTAHDMLQEYPELQNKPGLAYHYISPAVDLFLQTLPHTHKTYKYLWVIEDDVGYTGDNISKLLEKYSGNADDLIGGSQDDTMSGAEGTMTGLPRTAAIFYPELQTDLYKEWVGTRRLLAANHVTRMSSRLLLKLNHWLKAGAIDLGQCMPPTVCKIENMKASALNAVDMGSYYKLGNWQIDRNQWEAFKRKDAELGMPRLYHALKI